MDLTTTAHPCYQYRSVYFLYNRRVQFARSQRCKVPRRWSDSSRFPQVVNNRGRIRIRVCWLTSLLGSVLSLELWSSDLTCSSHQGITRQSLGSDQTQASVVRALRCCSPHPHVVVRSFLWRRPTAHLSSQNPSMEVLSGLMDSSAVVFVPVLTERNRMQSDLIVLYWTVSTSWKQLVVTIISTQSGYVTSWSPQVNLFETCANLFR